MIDIAVMMIIAQLAQKFKGAGDANTRRGKKVRYR